MESPGLLPAVHHRPLVVRCQVLVVNLQTPSFNTQPPMVGRQLPTIDRQPMTLTVVGSLRVFYRLGPNKAQSRIWAGVGVIEFGQKQHEADRCISEIPGWGG